MLKIVHHTPNKLILKDQRRWAGLGAMLFTLLSIGALGIFVGEIGNIIESRYARDGMLWVMVVIIFFCLIAGLVVIGAVATRHLWYGIHCILDWDAETLRLSRIDTFRPLHTTYPIYAIAGVVIESNIEMGVYGVFIILKSGKKVPLASFYVVDEETMNTIVKQIRTFLRG